MCCKTVVSSLLLKTFGEGSNVLNIHQFVVGDFAIGGRLEHFWKGHL